MKINILKEEIAYAAGFLDGEGCFFLGPYAKERIACENTYKPSIDWLHGLFGGTITVTKPRKTNHRITYRWSVVCRDAVKVCSVIAPYLKEKAEQALILIAISQTKKHGRLTPEVKEERERLAAKLKVAKGRLGA